MKGPFFNPTTISRSSTILPQFLGKTIFVHNGKELKSFGIITIDHIGKKFGQFVLTKIPAVYKR